MKNFYFLVLILTLSVTLTCWDEKTENEDVSVSKITFLDKGAVIPDPISIIINITPSSIEYSEIQSGNIIKSWNKSIDPSDFNLIEQIINNYALYKIDDIELPDTDIVCINDGWSGMEIMIELESLTHSFKISGMVCRKDWPVGVQELVKQRDNLITKYQ